MRYRDETEEEVRQRRELRKQQTEQRLAQKEKHLRIQEQKVKLLQEKRAKEEAEKKAKKVERLITLYHVKKAATTIADIAKIGTSLLVTLKFLAMFNPDAADAYNKLTERLNFALSAVIRGVGGAFGLLTKAISNVIQFLRKGKSTDVKLDSCYFTKRYRRNLRRDTRYSDLIAPLLAGITFKTTILPILGIALKAGVTAGVAGAISQGIIGPIINRIKQYGFSLISGKANGEFSESIIQKIKNDLGILVNVFRTKDPSVAQKLMAGLTKFKAVT